MNTQTIPNPKISFTLNANKVHDQLDTLRAALNELAREHGLDTAFDAGVLTDTLRDTPLGQRYLALTRRADLLTHLPDRRTTIAWGIVGGSMLRIARRRGWDKRARRTLSRAGSAMRRTGSRVRARFTRTPQMPAQFTVTPAAGAAYNLACNREVVRVVTPADNGSEVRTGHLITLNNEFFAVLVGEQPYVFLPDQIAKVEMQVAANDTTHATVVLAENPVVVPEL